MNFNADSLELIDSEEVDGLIDFWVCNEQIWYFLYHDHFETSTG